MSLVHNERVKALANVFHTLGVGTMLSGIVVPLAGERFSVLPGMPIWLGVGLGLIGIGYGILGRLRE